MKFFNSLTEKKEEFVPHGKVVKMYSCGPTVYKPAHIGNLRAYLFMDQLRRALKYNGYKVESVMNITDVGHLVSDEDSGEDRMEKQAIQEKLSPYDIANRITKLFIEDLEKLNVDLPEHIMKATDNIDSMIELVKKLEKKGFTYRTQDGIYFDTQKFKGYGKLSNKDFSKTGRARIDENTEKHHPFDFALWKFVPENHIMKWNSPWGVGCPGWHIECSAMGMKKLGEYIDIHTGGIEHRTVHHENEIAQSDCALDHKVVSYWLHFDHLQVDGGKMSKSLGNVYLLKDLEDKGYSPMDFKYFNLLTHYRKKINFTFEAVEASKNALKSLKETLILHKNSSDENIDLKTYYDSFKDAISDDLNYPKAIGIMWTMLKLPPNKNIYYMALEFDKALGLKLDEEEEIPAEVINLAEERKKARIAKDFKKSDEIRDKIFSLGYNILDTKDDYIVKRR